MDLATKPTGWRGALFRANVLNKLGGSVTVQPLESDGRMSVSAERVREAIANRPDATPEN